MGSPIFDSTFGTGRFKSEEHCAGKERVRVMTEDRITKLEQEINEDRITKLEQEIAEQEDLAARCLSEHRYVFDGRVQFLRAELARLRGLRAPSPKPQDVRAALELQLFDLVELARDSQSDKGGEAKWVHLRGALIKEFAKRIAALAQSDAGPVRAFAKAVLHGDDEHKAWLLEAAESFIAGKPLPAPRGKGTALAQPDAGPLRCLITGNPCGTDTWGKNSPCRCINCQMWLTQSNAEPVATSFREGGYIEDHLERIAQSDAEPEWDCFTQGCKQADTIDGLIGCAVKYRAKIKELEAAIVQSNAQPVAWQWQEKSTPEFGWAFCRNEEERFYMAQYPSKYNLRPLYTAPPRPDASGLIEAAEWRIISEALRIAREDGSIDNFATDAEYEALKEKVRSRAADRSVQWQTIETAPKDGTRILLANEVLFAAGQICRRIEPDWRYRGLENGKITERFTERIPNPDAGTVHEWWQKDYPSAFREEDATGPDYDGNSPAWEPTHWMPLPEPPIKVIPKKWAIPPLRYSDTAEHMPDGTEIRRLEIRK